MTKAVRNLSNKYNVGSGNLINDGSIRNWGELFKSERELKSTAKGMNIGLNNCSTGKNLGFRAKYATIYTEKNEFKLGYNSFNNNDILGCGV
uniref:Uncharacterized protein n=1 Tax=Meloidogyne incognita TaxID=6306 RepID=A0A914N6R4_MELIC